MARDGRETGMEPGETGDGVGSTVGEAGAELGSLFAQLRVSHRVAVWRADVRQGLSYLSVLDLPEEADPTWLLEHIRAQYGPGRYKLRPVGPSGKYQPGQATISLADDRRVSNPGSLMELLTQLRPAPNGNATAAAPVPQHEDTTRLLLGALLEGQGGERELVRSLLMRQADPTAELVRQAEHFRRLRNIFADPRADEPAPASNELGSPGMDSWLMQMLMGGMMGGGGMMPPGMGGGMMPPGMPPGMGGGMMPPGMPPGMGGGMMPPQAHQQRPQSSPAPAAQPTPAPPMTAEQGDTLAQVLGLLRKLDGEVASLRKEVADLQYEENEQAGEVVEFPSVPGMDLAGMARQFLNQQTGGSSSNG